MLCDRRMNVMRMGRSVLGLGTVLGVLGQIARNPWLWAAWPIVCLAIATMNRAILRRQELRPRDR
jgi:hypothetical protein